MIMPLIIIIRRRRRRRSHNSLAWDMQIHTNMGNCQRTSLSWYRANWCCKLIDVSVPSGRNTSTKSDSKYKDLKIKTTRMWGMRTEPVPVIVGGLGIREGMDQNLGTISEASYINKLGKIILLGTAHILRRFLSVKQKTPLVPQDQGMVPVLGECRKQLIALKTFIIMIIIMVYSQRVLLTEFTDFIYRCYCICRR